MWVQGGVDVGGVGAGGVGARDVGAGDVGAGRWGYRAEVPSNSPGFCSTLSSLPVPFPAPATWLG